MAAFTTAAGIFIGLTQLSNLFGFKVTISLFKQYHVQLTIAKRGPA